jgi:hypothetical protein
MEPALSLRGQVASQAQFIVCNLSQTSYTDVEHIDVDRGRYDCDCFAFAGFVMERSAPAHYHMIPKKEEGQPRRRTAEYYEFFSSLSPESAGAWRRIALLRDARRGDVIAWQPPKVGKAPVTGHVLFVARAPETGRPGTFLVRVYDSASQPHFGDTRAKAKEQPGNGVGSGVIKFRVDDVGRPAAVQLEPGAEFESLPIAIGRIEPLPVAEAVPQAALPIGRATRSPGGGARPRRAVSARQQTAGRQAAKRGV